MNTQNNITHYFFIGIGGIGMSGLARYFKARGFAVSGYDKTPSSMTKALENEGIPVVFNGSLSAVPKGFLNNTNCLHSSYPKISGAICIF